jgi:uncharacterized protein
MISPCINICTLDARTKLCVGCGRTLDEVAGWSTFSEGERASIMQQLPQRKAAADLAAAGLAVPAKITNPVAG